MGRDELNKTKHDIKMETYKLNIANLNKGFEMVNLYEIKCAQGHIINKYVPKFLKTPICTLCNFIDTVYLFKLLNERNIHYTTQQVAPSVTSNHYVGLRMMEQLLISIYDENNKSLGCIYFTSPSNKESININKDAHSKLFDYRKVNDVDHCETFLNEFLNK